MKDKFLGSYRNYLLLLLILLIAYLPLSSFLFALKNDAFTDNFPDKFFFSSALHSGHLPLWNPYMNFGFPIYADFGFAFYNPITWLFGIIGYNAFTFTIEVLLYIYLAGVNMYLLCKYLSFQNRVCLAVASMFMCSGFFVGNLQHINFLTATAFVPLVVKYLLSSLSNPSLKNSFYLAIAFFFVIMGGHPAIPIATVYFMLFITVSFLINHSDFILKRIGYLILAAVIFLSLSIQIIYSYLNILPFYSRGMPVAQDDLANVGTSISSLISFILPYSSTKGDAFFGTDLSMRNLYLSIVAILVIVAIKPTKKSFPFIIIGSIFFLFALGGDIKHLLYNHLPGLSYIRINGEFRMFTILCFCIAGGYNLNYLLDNLHVEVFQKHLKIVGRYFLMALVVFFLIVLGNTLTDIHLKESSFKVSISSLKEFLHNLSFKDCLLISTVIAIIFISTFLVLIKKKLFRLIPFLIILDVTINLFIYMPITGVGQKSVAFVQSIYNRSPKGIPIPSLTPLEKLDSVSTEESSLVGDWSYYNKQIGTKKITDYPSYFLSLESYFNSNNPSTINKKPYLFTKANDSKITVNSYNPQNIEITCSSSNADTLVFLQNNYKFWSATLNGKNQPISTAYNSFMAIPIQKGLNKIQFNYQDKGLLISFLISMLFFVFYTMKIFLDKRKASVN